MSLHREGNNADRHEVSAERRSPDHDDAGKSRGGGWTDKPSGSSDHESGTIEGERPAGEASVDVQEGDGSVGGLVGLWRKYPGWIPVVHYVRR